MGDAQRGGIDRLVHALRYSLQGIRSAWQGEPAFRQELAACVLLIPAAFWVGQTAVERGLLIGSCLLVLITELINSALEAVVDRIGPERHELSGRAKDQGSAAVLIALLLAAIVWGLIGWQRFFA